MKRTATMILCLLPGLTFAQDSAIINQYGQPTGYKVRTYESSASGPLEMFWAADYLGRNRAAASVPGQLSSVTQAAAAGYFTGRAMAREDKALDAQLAQINAELETQTNENLAKEGKVAVDKNAFDAWVYATAEITARYENILKVICAKNPKDARCSDDTKAQLPEMVVDALLKNDLVLVPKNEYYGRSEKAAKP